jgi:predicted enzyme related to lactoylglutathione lyase
MPAELIDDPPAFLHGPLQLIVRRQSEAEELGLSARNPFEEKMMHKSKLAGFIIDCRTNDLDAAAAFWGAALGFKVGRTDDPDDEGYTRLFDHQNDLHIEVQKVTHPSRVHLDIETDDLDAEVARLEKLGARCIQKIKRWWLMEAPTGQRFCVVRKSSPRFDAQATTWK